MFHKFTKRKSNRKSILLLVPATIALPVWGGQVDENTDEIVHFYVFGTENNIVVGDDRVMPVLSYSHTNGFSVDMKFHPSYYGGSSNIQSKYSLLLRTTLCQQLELRSNGRNILCTNNNEKEE